MSDFLRQMAEASAGRVAAQTRSYTDDELDRPVWPLRLSAFDVIAEIKNRSPAEGELAGGTATRAERARQYVDGGAAAISVLTEPQHFDGHLEHLAEVATLVGDRQVPVMRKDFLVHPQQILEAKAAGASGVLLIAAMLESQQLASMLDCAFEHGLFVLLESFGEADLELTVRLLERAAYREQAAQDKLLVGINTRDLRSLHVDPDRLRQLAPHLPADAACVAESGLRSAEDARVVAGWGYRLALVGTALMRATSPALLIRDMLAAGRGA